MGVRRVVTGEGSDGQARIVSDELVPALKLAMLPSVESHRLWGTDELPLLPHDGSSTPTGAHFPPQGGIRFSRLTLLPKNEHRPSPADWRAAAQELERECPGLVDYLSHPRGIHRTDTIDLLYILTGEVLLELDDGTTTVLRAGDTVVQCGTPHRWENVGEGRAEMLVVVLGTARSSTEG